MLLRATTTTTPVTRYYCVGSDGRCVEHCVECDKGWSAPVREVLGGERAIKSSTVAVDEKTVSVAERAAMWTRSLSDTASWLCVVDCTLLPLLAALSNLTGVATTMASSASSLPSWFSDAHDLGHTVATWFVLPVGWLRLATTLLSPSSAHGSSTPFAAVACTLAGLTCVYAANAEHDAPLLRLLPEHVAHDLHCGTTSHRATNLTGCLLLMMSNRWGGGGDHGGGRGHVHTPFCAHSRFRRRGDSKRRATTKKQNRWAARTDAL